MPLPFYGTIPDGSPGTDDLFAALLELRWKDVAMPFVSFTSEVRQDLAPHKFADRDGAHIEGTGRHPMEYSARVPFINGVAPGPGETFKRLYPNQRDQMLAVAVQGSSGILQHPELGPITCKLERFKWVLEAGVRGGVWADVAWVETDDTGDDLATALLRESPASGVQTAALDLDSQLSSVNPLWPQPYVPPFTFGDLAFAVRGVIDQVTLTQKEFGGRIDNFLYQAQALEDSCNSAANANALNWPTLMACELAKSSLYDLKATLLTQGRTIGFYDLIKDSTLSQVAASLGVAVSDIMILNPAFVQSPVVPAGSVLRYYA